MTAFPLVVDAHREGIVDRRVHRLRLGLQNEEYRSHAMYILEDALRLMELPGESAGRIYYFRRIQLPPMICGEHPAVYATRLEQCCRSAAERAVHFFDAAAVYSPVVFAHSAVEPWSKLARIFYSAEPLCWFWEIALPQARQVLATGNPSRILLHVAEHHGLASVIEFFARCGPEAIRSVMKGLRADEIKRKNLWPFSAAFRPSLDLESPPGPTSLNIIPSLWLQLALDYISHWSPDDPRSLWLVGILILLACPERALDARFELEARSTAFALADVSAVTSNSRNDVPDIHEPTRPPRETADHASPEGNANSYDEFTQTALSTQHAGFFFCLGILEHLAISSVLANHPEFIDYGFIRILLSWLAAAAAITDGDPASDLAGWFVVEHADAGDAGVELSATMLPEALRVISSRSRASTVNHVARAWVLAVRRWIRRSTGMTLHQLSTRPGRIHATPTHLEIVMPQSAMDIRIRKAGIDVNPNWLPWLGKVVSFRYMCEVVELQLPKGRPSLGAWRVQRGRI